jgi:hypothetical protein
MVNWAGAPEDLATSLQNRFKFNLPIPAMFRGLLNKTASKNKK